MNVMKHITYYILHITYYILHITLLCDAMRCDDDNYLSHRTSVGAEGRHSFLAAADTAAAALALLLGLHQLLQRVVAAALLLLLRLHELLQGVAATLTRLAMMLRPRLALRLIMLPVGLLGDLQDLLERLIAIALHRSLNVGEPRVLLTTTGLFARRRKSSNRMFRH